MKRLSNLSDKLILFSLILLGPHLVWAAACCGGGAASSSLILGDDLAQMTGSYSYTDVAVDSVDGGGLWHKSDQHQMLRTYKLEGAHVFADRWQVGGSLPVIERTQLGNSNSGLSDVAVSVGYEYLPDWDYNPWRPKGIGYLQLTLPTGQGKAESQTGIDSRGSGFWAVGLGTVLSKNFASWDVSSAGEFHRSFGKDVHTAQVNGHLSPGFGGTWSLGGGYNWQRFRLGSAMSWTYEDPVRGSANPEGQLERFATASLSVSYLEGEDWMGGLTYSDQTWLGSPLNTSLGQTWSFQLVRRWAR